MLRAIALDLSLAATGVAWTCDHHGRPNIGCRTVHTRRNITGPGIDHTRVHNILVDVAAAVRCNPHLAVVEWLPQYEGKGDASLRLAELHGVVKQWLWTRGVPYVDVRPVHLKMWATGNGNATKTAVKAAVIAAYGSLVHVGDDNQADAVALLSMACAAYGAPLAEVPDTHRRALAAVTWPDISLEQPLSGAAAVSTGAGRGPGGSVA